MVSIVPGTFTGVSAAAARSDGRLACTDFAHQDGPGAVQSSLGRRDLSAFQAYVVSEFAAEYLCPTQLPHALTDLRLALLDGS
jgi:hypothetical protein